MCPCSAHSQLPVNENLQMTSDGDSCIPRLTPLRNGPDDSDDASLGASGQATNDRL